MSKLLLHIADKPFTIEERNNEIVVDGKRYSVNARKITENEYSILVDGKSYHVFFNNCQKCFCARIDNHVFEIKRQSLREQLTEKYLKSGKEDHSTITIKAPMPGMITKVLRIQNAMVTEGEGILVIEAMKMENELKSSKSGIVKKIFVKEKQTVEKGDPLFTIE